MASAARPEAVTRVHLDADDRRHPREVGVLSKERCLVAAGDRGDEAVRQPSGGDTCPPALPVDAGGGLEVDRRIHRKELEAQEQPAEGRFATVAASAGQDLHDHGLGDAERGVVLDELAEPSVN
jgi:hypothetical protein